MTAPATRDPILDLRRRVAELEAEVPMLRRLVRAQQADLEILWSRFAPERTPAEIAVALAHSTAGADFTATELLAHAAVDDDLAAVLRAARADTPRKIGKLLAKLASIDFENLQVESIGCSRDGRLWRACLKANSQSL